MITRTRRYMNADEQREVERLTKDGRQVAGCQIAVLVSSFLVSAAIAGGIGMAVGGLKLAGSGVVAALAFTIWLWRDYRYPRSFGLLSDRHETEVELLHVHAFSVTRVPDAFFFDVGEGNVLYTHGPYLRAAILSGRFPNRYFTLVRLPRANTTLRVDCHGEPMTSPSAPPGPEIDFERIPDAAILPARLETLRQDLASHFGKKSA